MEFLYNTDNIRNICILAHVDHGKTTIADSLIASNGIISHKMAGKLRYLDNRQEEQERGITMKSSSIALKYANDDSERFLINLVDTPGHVDFCGEVSAAVRLCDGALIVVDVVEGVCPQTKVALEQAWKEGIEPILVLNKLDRLILEQQLDETAAYLRLNQLLEQINAIVATLLTTELFEDESKLDFTRKRRKSTKSESESHNSNNVPQIYDWASAIEDIDDDKFYFMPEKNNVIFASSIDDWAFTVEAFAKILSERHKINLSALKKTLWGDFYIDIKQKRILHHAQVKAKKTLFTSMVLENIWRIYDIVAKRRDKDKMLKVCETLGIEMSKRDLNHNDSRYQTKLIMSKWLQLSKHTLDCVCKIVPSPKSLSEKRVERLLSSNMRRFQHLPEETKRLKSSFLSCSYDDSAVKVACVSKMIAFDKKSLPEYRRPIIHKSIASSTICSSSHVDDSAFGNDVNNIKTIPDNETEFIAFARIFSGKLNKGDKLFVLGPRHDPGSVAGNLSENIDETKKLDDLRLNEHITVATVDKFYLLMGRDIEPIDCALAGNIVGIAGLDKHLVRTATLSSDLYCPAFNDLHVPAAPILRVAVEPKNPSDTPAFMKGLKLLNQADPCVEVRLQHTGEHVIVATGEVHLQHCIKDLKERYTENIELNVSSPIVPFRETVVLPPKTDMVNETIDDNNTVSAGKKQVEKEAIAEISTPNKRCKFRIRAWPIPSQLTSFLLKHQEDLKVIAKLMTTTHQSGVHDMQQLSHSKRNSLEKFRSALKKVTKECQNDCSDWKNIYCDDFVDKIWCFGPKYSGSNLLVSSDAINLDYNIWSRLFKEQIEHKNSECNNSSSSYIDSFISGFQLATQSGPLCEEPMSGVGFTLLEWSSSLSENNQPDESNSLGDKSAEGDDVNSESGSMLCYQKDNYGPLSGQIISTAKDGCRRAFQLQPQRLMSPMFSCNIQVTTEVLGKMYAVLGRRHGRIVHGDMREGSQTFDIQAFIPVIESLDFVNEIRKQTSGMANPQLIFSHYELIDVDPFWTPCTEEEYALYGDKADTENLARKYMNLVRKRKGLSVQEKTVEHGEKQRTIKRNK